METKNTPGPWKHAGGFDDFEDIRGANDELIATMHCQNYGTRKADARLIAASHDLLEKARAVIAWWDTFVPTTSHDAQPEVEDAEFREFSQLRAAIAKALGHNDKSNRTPREADSGKPKAGVRRSG